MDQSSISSTSTGEKRNLGVEGNEFGAKEFIVLGNRYPSAYSYAALLLSVLVTSFLVAVVFVTIPITGFAVVLSNTGRTFYTAGTTILAGLISAFVLGQVKELWAVDVLYVSGSSAQQNTLHDKFNPFRRVTYRALKKGYGTQSEVRTIVGMGSTSEKAHFWLQTMSSLAIGLTTTAIVTGLTPSVYTSSKQAEQWSVPLNTDSCPTYSDNTTTASSPEFCLSIVNETASPKDTNSFVWKIGNGERLQVDPLHCENQTNDLAQPTSRGLFAGIAYSVQNFPVRSGAIGMPIVSNGTTAPKLSGQYAASPGTTIADEYILSNADKDALSNFGVFRPSKPVTGLYGAGQFVRSEACLPVLASNPVTCRGAMNSVVLLGNQTTAVGDGCNATFHGNSSFAVNFCVNESNNGDATYVLGTKADPDFLAPFFPEFNHTRPGSLKNFTVTCKVNLLSALGFRNVRLDFLGQVNGDSPQRQMNLTEDPDLVPGRPFSILQQHQTQYAMSGTRSACAPRLASGAELNITEAVPNLLVGYSAASIWPRIRGIATFDEQAYGLLREAVHADKSLFIFEGSQNGFEDLLGLYQGYSISQYYSISSTEVSYSTDTPDSLPLGASRSLCPRVTLPPATMTATSTRIGVGQPWAIVYILPSLYSAILLAWLMRRRAVWAHKEERSVEKEGVMKSLTRVATGAVTADMEEA